MKRLFMILLLLGNIYASQAQERFAGTWEGKLDIGQGLRVVFHLVYTDGRLVTKMDSPDQGAKGISCYSNIAGDSIAIEIPSLKGRYAGQLTNDEYIKGILIQQQQSIALLLHKRHDDEIRRPQTPHPPYPYVTIEVAYENVAKTIHYGGTLTMPKGAGPFPAILLISGSGQQNRDEELAAHKPFAVIADYLTRNGYAVLRVDDRGVGSTTGDVMNATTDDFVKDAKNHVAYLRTVKEINKSKIGLLGHSEGGLIAEILAAENANISFIILNAAPGVPTVQLMEEQNYAYLNTTRMDTAMIEDYMRLYRAIASEVLKTSDTQRLSKNIVKQVKEWRKNTDAKTVMITTGIANDSTEVVMTNALVETFTMPWVMKFMKYKPADYLKQVTCKVLAINGSKDIQVLPKSNLEGIKAALAKSKSPKYDVIELPGLNHLFQECDECIVDEYKKLDETFSPVALKTIKDWLDKEVK